jgi:hypothetical protein
MGNSRTQSQGSLAIASSLAASAHQPPLLTCNNQAVGLTARVGADARGRACRILRVARTIADLESANAITVHHVSEALLFRQLDGEGLDVYANTTRKLRAHEARPGSGIH